jgi:hypothetical protein
MMISGIVIALCLSVIRLQHDMPEATDERPYQPCWLMRSMMRALN